MNKFTYQTLAKDLEIFFIKKRAIYVSFGLAGNCGKDLKLRKI